MSSLIDQAVCLRCWEWSETSQVAALLTRDHGVVRGLAKGARRPRGSFSGGLEAMTRGQLIAIPKPGSAMATLTSWEVLETFPAARGALKAFHAGMYVLDLAYHALRESDPHPGLYDRLVESLRALEKPDGAVLRFQWATLVEIGYKPEIRLDARTGEPLPQRSWYTFSSDLGGLTTRENGEGSGTWRVRHETVELLRGLDRGDKTPPAEPALGRANRLLALHLARLFGAPPPSLQMVFPDLSLQALP